MQRDLENVSLEREPQSCLAAVEAAYAEVKASFNMDEETSAALADLMAQIRLVQNEVARVPDWLADHKEQISDLKEQISQVKRILLMD